MSSTRQGTVAKGQLAINGGPKVRTTPFDKKGNRYAFNELKYLKEAIDQGTLFYWHGQKVKAMCQQFAQMLGVKHAAAGSSCTAVIHAAVGALGISSGDEVITSPITDAGTIIGVLYQHGIPVFADLDPSTYTITADSIARKITPRTKGIIAVHLWGNPCPMDEILELAKAKGLWVIEDCAQAMWATYKGRLVGTMGNAGAFSFNEFKHLACGDGGVVVTNDEQTYRLCHLYADKAYDRFGGGRVPEFLAPNYRMTELQGAVISAQLERVEQITNDYRRYARILREGLRDLPAVAVPKETDGSDPVYWFYLPRLRLDKLACTREEFATAVAAEGVQCGAGYVTSCVYQQPYLGEHKAFGASGLPWSLGNNVQYRTGDCPNAEAIVADCIFLPVSDRLCEQDARDTVAAVTKVHDCFYNGK
jgi:dTDP-4-amino-4,6-dideoxygalactose transaminase